MNAPNGVRMVGINSIGRGFVGAQPVRVNGAYRFEDAPEFKPNLSPKQILHYGAFGGGYFRMIKSGELKATLKDVWKELPSKWIEGLEVKRHLASKIYRTDVNRYKVNCGAKADKSDTFGLEFWEQKGWILAQDPYGWFMWYCRFFQGRRSDDDERQISRWCKCAGVTGRWRQNLIAKCLKAGALFDDVSVSPVVRQTLLHWAYDLTQADYERGCIRVRERGATYVPRAQLKGILVEKKNGESSLIAEDISEANESRSHRASKRAKR